jgi:Flp pilus assembly protein TadD
MCASCHARSTGLTGDFTPGDSFYDHYSLEILDDARRWYPDGQIKDEDYEFTSFLGSKMSQAGVTCLDCHTRDVTKPQLKGNDLCLRCHNGGFPKAPVIDPAGHGHHSLTGRGGECVACHLPVTVYMQRHPRHDHGFTLPDPLLTKQLGIPNACNRCHEDKTTDWALNYVEQWYGAKMNRPTRTRTQWMAAAENGDPQARQPLLDLLADTNQSPYWQAVAVHFLGQWAAYPATRTALLQHLHHPHPLVRARAAQSLEPALTDPQVAAALQLTLTDPVRSVRLATAWTLRATLDLHSPTGREFQQALDVEADQPTGQFKAAMFLLARGHVTEALPHLEKAAAWDPISPPYQCVRAQVLDQLGQTTKALDILTRETAAIPDDPQTAYVLAAILARHGRNEEARTAANRVLTIQRDFRPALDLLRTLSETTASQPGPHP